MSARRDLPIVFPTDELLPPGDLRRQLIRYRAEHPEYRDLSWREITILALNEEICR